MIYRKVLLVWLLLAAMSASSVRVVEAKTRDNQTKAGKEADLGASECKSGKKGKKCKLKRTKDKDIFTAKEISIQLEDDGIIQDFVGGGSRKGGKNQHQQSWYGVSDGFALNLIESEGLLFGSASDNNFIYSISTDDDGNPIVKKKATADFPDELDDADLTFETFPGKHTDGEGPGEGEPNNDNVFAHESTRKRGLRGRSSSSYFLNTTQERQLTEEEDTIFDIMVVWTTNAECNNSDEDNGCTTTAATETAIRGLIDLAVAETNVAFEESDVNVMLRLVHAYRDPSYTEDGLSNALKDITFEYKDDASYAAMDDVHAIRADVGADLVAMIIHDPTSCGTAWLGPTKHKMFSVSHWDCATGYFSFGHEIGHNLVSSSKT
jgi:hypothetical protein